MESELFLNFVAWLWQVRQYFLCFQKLQPVGTVVAPDAHIPVSSVRSIATKTMAKYERTEVNMNVVVRRMKAVEENRRAVKREATGV